MDPTPPTMRWMEETGGAEKGVKRACKGAQMDNFSPRIILRKQYLPPSPRRLLG